MALFQCLGVAASFEFPSGKRLQFAMEHHHAIFMGKSTISMAIFTSYVKLPEGIIYNHKDGVTKITSLIGTDEPGWTRMSVSEGATKRATAAWVMWTGNVDDQCHDCMVYLQYPQLGD